MAKVLEHLTRPQKKAVHRSPKALELQTAKEILAEVFQIRLAEVDEMTTASGRTARPSPPLRPLLL